MLKTMKPKRRCQMKSKNTRDRRGRSARLGDGGLVSEESRLLFMSARFPSHTQGARRIFLWLDVFDSSCVCVMRNDDMMRCELSLTRLILYYRPRSSAPPPVRTPFIVDFDIYLFRYI